MRWRGVAKGAVRSLARSLDLDVVERSVYSPVPEVPPPGSAVWSRRTPSLGFELDPLTSLEYLESTLASYLVEFRPPHEPTGRDGEFYLRNWWYGPVDAEVLYAMVRHHKPRRLLELGAGYSTLVSARACAANAGQGHPAEFVAVDPEPRTGLGDAIPGLTRLERRRATELALERFLALERGDVLFVDTSHTVKLGSEVNHVILEVLPQLAAGVLVHFHDIFLPYEYPRAFFARCTYLAEQYLLQAFLSCNPSYEVLFAAHAVARDHFERLARLIPSLREVEHGPAAFWLRRRLDAPSS